MLIQSLVERQEQEHSSQTLQHVETLGSAVSGKPVRQCLDSLFYRTFSYVSKVISAVNDRFIVKISKSGNCLAPCSANSVMLEHPIVAEAIRTERQGEAFHTTDMELFLSVCDIATAEKVGIFLLGSQLNLLKKVKSQLERDFPGIQIVDAIPLGFYPASDREIQSIVQKINGSRAEIVFVSLGCRHQALWMAKQRSAVQATMLGLGSVFPRYVGLGKASLN
jgi:N-acetylglucosaminyldiphosphoundecaprenol N-acetyl-beta-D-mannosaminyltransferase